MLRITDECIVCGACAAECPRDAIFERDHYEIDAQKCDECGGDPACQQVCPCECIVSAEGAPQVLARDGVEPGVEIVG
jgi:ferredoxin